MKKIFLIIGFILCFYFNSSAIFYFNVCRTILNNGGGKYSTATRNVEDHFDMFGKLIGQDVSIFCAGNGDMSCPKEIAPTNNNGGGGEIEDLPNNVFLFCQQLFEDLCDGENDELFPYTFSILGSDNVIYYVNTTITEIESGTKYNLLIWSN